MSDPLHDVSIPALMRAARGAYARTIAEHLAAEGYDDMPRNGLFVIGGVANHGASVADMIDGLKVTRQAASQLIDTMVLRGYLSREANPDDRRRITIALTPRGEGAAEAMAAAVATIDEQLAARLTPEQLDGLRAGLAALAEIKKESE
jgi:DNA-binding MarR family transcriptional regulator